MIIKFSRFDTVEVFDETLPIAFNMKAIADFEEETGIKLFALLEIIGKGSFDPKIIPLIWFALVQGYQLEHKIQPPFSREQLNAMDLDVLMIFINALTKSIEKMGESQKKQLAAEANKRKAKN